MGIFWPGYFSCVFLYGFLPWLCYFCHGLFFKSWFSRHDQISKVAVLPWCILPWCYCCHGRILPWSCFHDYFRHGLSAFAMVYFCLGAFAMVGFTMIGFTMASYCHGCLLWPWSLAISLAFCHKLGLDSGESRLLCVQIREECSIWFEVKIVQFSDVSIVLHPLYVIFLNA